MIALYFFNSILVGGVLFTEGIILLKQNGKWNGSRVLLATTVIEFIWIIVSVLALAYLGFASWYALIPLAYVVYCIVGMFLGFRLGSEMECPDDPLLSIVIPKWYINFEIGFGLFFALFANYAYAHLG